VIRITRGNFRLMERLFAQMRRIMTSTASRRSPLTSFRPRAIASSSDPATDK
jgi:hypothetical protein